MVERYRRKIKRIERKPRPLYPKQRIKVNWNPLRFGTIVLVGRDVSQIKWDNPIGNDIYEANKNLLPLDEEE